MYYTVVSSKIKIGFRFSKHSVNGKTKNMKARYFLLLSGSDYLHHSSRCSLLKEISEIRFRTASVKSIAESKKWKLDNVTGNNHKSQQWFGFMTVRATKIKVKKKIWIKRWWWDQDNDRSKFWDQGSGKVWQINLGFLEINVGRFKNRLWKLPYLRILQ